MNNPTQIPQPEILCAMLGAHEGYRPEPYLCPAGYWTIAIGRNIEAKPLTLAEMRDLMPDYNSDAHEQLETLKEFLFEHPVDRATAEKWLLADLEEFHKGCREDYPGFDEFPVSAQHALIDMSYNMGRAGLRGFPGMNAAIRDRDWEKAAAEALDSKWAREDVQEARSSKISSMIRAAGER